MKGLSVILSFILIIATCKKEQLSDDTRMLNFSVTDLNRPSFILDKVFIDESNQIISLLFNNRIPTDSLPLSFVSIFSLPAGASSIPASGETITLTSMDDLVKYTVTAENGRQVEYIIVSRDNQLPNSGFEDWHTRSGLNGQSYEEPGKYKETTVWSTANSGTSVYGVYGTKPVTFESNTVAQITTGETSMVPIVAGTLFTGKFDINGALNNPTDPKKATLFGIPFTLRPAALKFKYTYQPGSRYIHATLNNPDNIFGGFTVTDIDGVDMFTAYAVLEIRDGANVLEIGRAEIISGEIQNELIEISIPFNYINSQKPTHISVVFASSTHGDLFTGAVGSTLTVDDLELIYE